MDRAPRRPRRERESMARLPLEHENDPATDPAILDILDRIAASGFPKLNVLRALANKPAALEGFMGFINAVYNNGTGAGFSSLTPKETELAYTTATVANDCHY
jgi:alkylhydroperoxidase family enzyme